MKRPRLLREVHWRPVLVGLVVVVISLFALTWQLGTLAPHLSANETKYVASSSQGQFILRDLRNLPDRLLTWAAVSIPIHQPVWQARAPNVIFGLVSLGLGLYILHRWYGKRSAIFGFALFISSAWLLHVARFAGADVEYLAATLALIASGVFLHDHEDSLAAWYIWLATNVVLLFIPGMVWFVILGSVWQWRAIVRAFGQQSFGPRLISVASPVLAIGAIALSVVVSAHHALMWLGLPPQLSLGVLRALPDHLLGVVSWIAWRGPQRPELWLGDVPILNDFLLVMLAAGLYFYARHWQATRTKLLLSYILLGVLLCALGQVSLSVVVPLLYIVAVAGIAYILQFWLRVFPRNPIARSFGIGLITIAVGLSCYFGLAQYFIAWPNSPVTRNTYK